ncbi:MAG: ABC transporter ATP-binding protein [Deltaproteobacteria bacterium CG_4_10_14_0_2_um_filter_43_8]|nr:MAG: ABC transporter ATP-binding protein [Deltaproteobacteria bacterium CG11_big_fil_rev_8_21_14_0_20_42_23]PJA20560.1 MAG: ABC transporter ATP-binding protein [Deltaproteobacteria bacterium CG_4_10_14_0_2_um_filter_43_8]PJC64220.1 MAG: ABC transporter ATP-binding protein [Deltaproteobacteria bacterium CG_4_9_14_0_2_um_filter_42_21]
MIELKNICKSFGEQQVLKNLSLSLPKGKITVIIGGSGSGKTVTLRHMIGLLKPDRGQVLVDGVDINKLGRVELNECRKKFGMLFQHAALFDSLNVEENIAFPLREHRQLKDEKKIREIVAEKLELVGLPGTEKKMPSELSGGMAKRVGLARAIALEPEIILYDEPTTGLDPLMTLAIDNLIYSMQQKLNITSIVISHDISSTLRIADQIAMLYQGEMIEVADPETFQKSDNPVVQEFLNVSHQKISGGKQ